MPKISITQVRKAKMYSSSAKDDLRNYLNKNSDVKGISVLDWVSSKTYAGKLSENEMNKDITNYFVALDNLGPNIKEDNALLVEYKTAIKNTYNINDAQIDKFKELYNKSFKDLDGIDSIGENGEELAPVKKEEKKEKPLTVEEKKEIYNKNFEELMEKTDRQIQQQLDGKVEEEMVLRQDAKLILLNEKLNAINNSKREYNSLSKADQMKKGLIFDGKFFSDIAWFRSDVEGVHKRDKIEYEEMDEDKPFFAPSYAESVEKSWNQTINGRDFLTGEVDNTLAGNKNTEIDSIKNNIQYLRAKEIGTYLGLKDKINSRSGISKFFHPFRTYKEATLLSKMETRIKDMGIDPKILDTIEQNTHDSRNTKLFLSIKSVDEDGKILSDEVSREEIMAKVSEIKEDVRKVDNKVMGLSEQEIIDNNLQDRLKFDCDDKTLSNKNSSQKVEEERRPTVVNQLDLD